MKKDILLIHGISSNGKVFGPSIGPGLKKLLEKDFSVHIGNLRVGPVDAGQHGWDFDDHLNIDIPTIWKEVRAKTNSEPGVLGYSMGGMLALVAQAKGLIQAPKLMILGSPVIFPDIPFYPKLMKKVLALAKISGLKRIPIRLGSKFLFWYFVSLGGGRDPSGLKLFHVLARRAGVNIPLETLVQAEKWVSSKFFCDRSGKIDYLPLLKKISVPIMFLAGQKDRIAPPPYVWPGYEMVASSQKHFLTIPNATHFDLIGGPTQFQIGRIASQWFIL